MYALAGRHPAGPDRRRRGAPCRRAAEPYPAVPRPPGRSAHDRGFAAREHGGALVNQRLRPLIRAVEVFGFHLATVDLRQSSDKHEAVVADPLKIARIEPDASPCPKTPNRPSLVRLLDDAQACCACPTAPKLPLTVSELAIFSQARTAHARYGRAAIRHYIISHTETVSDLLEALLLQKEVGLMRGTPNTTLGTDVSPLLSRGRVPGRPGVGTGDAVCDLIVVLLFETIEDLRNAADRRVLLRPARADARWCAARVPSRRDAGLQRQQQGRRHLHQQLGALPRGHGPGEAVRRNEREP